MFGVCFGGSTKAETETEAKAETERVTPPTQNVTDYQPQRV